MIPRDSSRPPLVTARFRFYGDLNDFLYPHQQRISFYHTVKGHPAVKDTLEALGVPHTEIDGIFVNGRPRDFSYQWKEGDSIKVYPGDYPLKGRVRHLKPRARKLHFVLDSHLGKLAHHLRLLGFDTIYKKYFPDTEIIRIGVSERRVILTRDIGLLKNKLIRLACWIRSADPKEQLKEILRKYDLSGRLKPFSLCLECNGRIKRVAKKRVAAVLPPKVREYHRRFYMCQSCRKIYWQGSHYARLMKLIATAQKKGGTKGKEKNKR